MTSTKIGAAFLAAVLVAGTIAAISPSSFIIGANAQGETYDYGIDRKYNSYEQDYEMDNYDKKPYGNSYGQDYPSYKPEYKKDSYSKDRDYDKSKDSSNSVSIKKIKCNNINVNLNNIDATLGSPIPSDDAKDGAPGGALAAQGGGAVAANGLMNGGNNGDRSFVDRENNFAFVCINNNNNVVSGGGDNVTDGNGNDVEACEDCFEENLIPQQFGNLEAALTAGIDITLGIGNVVEVGSFVELCALIQANPLLIATILLQVLDSIDAGTAPLIDIAFCLATALDIDIPPISIPVG
jgi:hypothetical protein